MFLTDEEVSSVDTILSWNFFLSDIDRNDGSTEDCTGKLDGNTELWSEVGDSVGTIVGLSNGDSNVGQNGRLSKGALEGLLLNNKVGLLLEGISEGNETSGASK